MFGQQDDQNYQPASDPSVPDDVINALAPAPAAAATSDSVLSAPTIDEPAAQASDPMATLSTFAVPPAGTPDPVPDQPTTTGPAEPTAVVIPDNLLEIKQKALGQLSPLVGHLDQTPEEKFRTTMMMIQATDDRSMIKTAHQAAEQIVDEKTRAQALLDIINEINYFTLHDES